MAPLACRYVEHGLYCMPFFINPTAGHGIIEVRHAWYAEHEDELGSFSEFEFIEKLTPKRLGDNRDKESVSGVPIDEQYEVPKKMREGFSGKLKNKRLYDLCVELPEWCTTISE